MTPSAKDGWRIVGVNYVAPIRRTVFHHPMYGEHVREENLGYRSKQP